MKQFMMLFWSEPSNESPSPEEMQAIMKDWNDWIGGIAAQGKLVGSEALGGEGRTLDANGVVSDGPYTEMKEIVGGYLIAKAESLDEAVKLSEGCPMYAAGGKVEVRDIMVFDM